MNDCSCSGRIQLRHTSRRLYDTCDLYPIRTSDKSEKAIRADKSARNGCGRMCECTPWLTTDMRLPSCTVFRVASQEMWRRTSPCVGHNEAVGKGKAPLRLFFWQAWSLRELALLNEALEVTQTRFKVRGTLAIDVYAGDKRDPPNTSSII